MVRMPSHQKLHMVQDAPDGSGFVIRRDFESFRNDLKSAMEETLAEMQSIVRKQRRPRDKKDIECYKCHEKGHFARNSSAKGQTEPWQNGNSEN